MEYHMALKKNKLIPIPNCVGESHSCDTEWKKLHI